MKIFFRFFSYLILASLISGCATLATRVSKSDFENDYYPATKQDTQWVSDDQLPLLGRFLLLADYPLSIAFDTILFPWDFFTVEDGA
jgi:uncharacterized protein YceK